MSPVGGRLWLFSLVEDINIKILDQELTEKGPRIQDFIGYVCN